MATVNHRPGKANQPIRRDKTRRYRPKRRACGFHHTDQLFSEVYPRREAVGRANFQAEPKHKQIGDGKPVKKAQTPNINSVSHLQME